MAVITIDGTRLEVRRIKMYWNVRWKPGIYIPHLCHHPDRRRMVPAACVL